MRRFLVSLGAVALVSGLAAAPASAQQSVNFTLGGFVPRSNAARDCTNFATGDCDVLVENGTFLSTFNRNNGIDIGEFNGPTVGGEWLFALGHNFEGGLGVGYYQRSVATSYTDFVNQDGSEIAQTLKLRVVPFSATFRVLPFGRNQPLEPYFGGGVGIFAFRYTESGQFIDQSNNVFAGTFTGSGSTAGPIILGGVRVPIDAAQVGFEARYQYAIGTLPADQGFAGSKIDLGGMSYLFTIGFRF